MCNYYNTIIIAVIVLRSWHAFPRLTVIMSEVRGVREFHDHMRELKTPNSSLKQGIDLEINATIEFQNMCRVPGCA